jgi:alpha-galactosidase
MSTISYGEAAATWLLQMPSSCYGLAVSGPARLPVHLHWGRRLGHEALAAMAGAGELFRHTEHTSWAEEDRLEYVAWGGRRYDEPSLKVDFPDGNRGIEWRLGGSRVEDEEGASVLVLELMDLVYPLTAELYYRVFDDCDVLERWARVRHTGDEGTFVVRQAHSANWWLPARDAWRLTYLHGGWGAEDQLDEAMLRPAKTVLESRRGTTSHEAQPFFALDDGHAGEESGEVWSGQLAWSGSWKVVCERTTGGYVHVSGGWNDFDAPLSLGPGEVISLPVFAGAYTNAGFGAMSRAWHAYELGHVLAGPRRRLFSPSFPGLPPTQAPAPRGRANGSIRPAPATAPAAPTGELATGAPALPALRPVLYNSWEATLFDVNEEGQAHLAELAAAIGCELFVVDDGWFVGRKNDHAGLGDWTVDREKFPLGLTPLIERVHNLGMGFGLWIEPEMVNPDSELYRAHPDWVFHFPNRRRTEKRNQLVLNFARDDVAEWAYATIDRLLTENDIAFVKWDMNRHFSEPGWPAEVGHNPERAWVRHTANVYTVLERLHDAHPTVDFESCSGGGGRVDLGMLSRVRQVWTSDNTDAWDRVAIQEGFSYAHAPLSMMAWVTDSPNPLTRRRLPLSYRFHVAMAGSLGVGGNLSEWSAEQLSEARELVSLYKSARHVVQHGHLYRLASSRLGALGAVQYISRDAAEVVVLAWTGVRRYGPWPAHLRLAALPDEAAYRHRQSGAVHLGSVLTQLGLALPAGHDWTSMFVHLERVG